MNKNQLPREFPNVTRVVQHVWLAVAFVFVWLHFSYVGNGVRHQDWQLYTLYFLAVGSVVCRYVTGIRHGRERWHRVLFDGLFILFISVGVHLTGKIHSDLWLLYFIFVIVETLAASPRAVIVTDTAAVISYVVATWPRGQVTQDYGEMLVTRIFFLMLVASIARTIAADERTRQEDMSALREALSISEERRRLARDLHDGIGHVLTRVILSLEIGKRQHATESPAASAAMAQQADALRSAMEEMRQIVATLRTDTTSLDVRTTVRVMAAELEESGSLSVNVELPDAPLPLSPHRQYHLSRVIQEALTNCMRHAQARNVWVKVTTYTPPAGIPLVTTVISDDGIGFAMHDLPTYEGHGLRGMKERLEAYGGNVIITSQPGQGTRVTAELPADEIL